MISRFGHTVRSAQTGRGRPWRSRLTQFAEIEPSAEPSCRVLRPRISRPKNVGMFAAKIWFRGAVGTIPAAPIGFRPGRFGPIFDRRKCAITLRDRPARHEWPGQGRRQELLDADARMSSAGASRRVAAESARYRLNRSFSRQSEELRPEQSPGTIAASYSSPSRCARFRASLRDLRIPSALSRARRSEGFS